MSELSCSWTADAQRQLHFHFDSLISQNFSLLVPGRKWEDFTKLLKMPVSKKAVLCELHIKLAQRLNRQACGFLVDSQGEYLQDWLHSDLRLRVAEQCLREAPEIYHNTLCLQELSGITESDRYNTTKGLLLIKKKSEDGHLQRQEVPICLLTLYTKSVNWITYSSLQSYSSWYTSIQINILHWFFTVSCLYYPTSLIR